ncbi:MAG: DUF4143 domain-containing protein [archaeon]|nr:DUF4143 domain-containing protein [archaeon]
MDPSRYRPRLVDKVLERRLHSSGAILLTGPKGCGKSTTGLMNSRSSVMLQGAEGDNTLATARSNPSIILEGETPRLIDEWQMAPALWDAVRTKVDEREGFGHFILTGSSVPQDDGYRHSGVGRISELRMYPMSLQESGDSSGTVSLARLFDGTQRLPDSCSVHDLKGVVDLVVRGGWPRAVGMDPEYAPDLVQNYYNATIGIDVFRVDGRKKDTGAVDRLMRSYSRNISTMASTRTIMTDVTSGDNSISQSTLEDYIDALRRLYVIEDVPAWSPSIRSKNAIRQSPKRQFVDPSLAVAALGLSRERLLNDLNTFGFLLESLCARDLRVYSALLNGSVLHYHDSNDLEADLVIQLRDGRWGCVEVKTGGRQAEEGKENLRRLRDQAVEAGHQAPSFMMILISNGYVSLDADGIWTVPIDCLGP